MVHACHCGRCRYHDPKGLVACRGCCSITTAVTLVALNHGSLPLVLPDSFSSPLPFPFVASHRRRADGLMLFLFPSAGGHTASKVERYGDLNRSHRRLTTASRRSCASGARTGQTAIKLVRRGDRGHPDGAYKAWRLSATRRMGLFAPSPRIRQAGRLLS